MEPPIHERVKSHFDGAGLTYADIAEQTGWQERKVVRLLTGATDLKIKHLEVFAVLLGKPVTAFYRAAKITRKTRSEGRRAS